MTPILISGRNMISNSNSLISTSKTLVLHPDDQNLWQLLAQHSKSLTDSIRNLVNSIRNNSPGQKECTKAAGNIPYPSFVSRDIHPLVRYSEQSDRGHRQSYSRGDAAEPAPSTGTLSRRFQRPAAQHYRADLRFDPPGDGGC